MEVSGQLHGPRGKSPGTHWTGGWVGPRVRLEAVRKTKISCFCRESNPNFSEPVALYEPIISNRHIRGRWYMPAATIESNAFHFVIPFVQIALWRRRKACGSRSTHTLWQELYSRNVGPLPAFPKKRLAVQTLLYKCPRMRIITGHVLPAKLRLHVTLHYTPRLLGVRMSYSTL
jgi:hypothetical protein